MKTLQVFTPPQTKVTPLVQDKKITCFQFEGTDELEVSDGYHTMKELYEHRFRLYLALVKVYDNYITPMDCRVKCWKSRAHSDGSPMFEGMFLLGMTVTQPRSTFDPNEPDKTYQITYHLPDRLWHLAKVIEMETPPQYDGHTSQDVLERLLRL